ncbi:hypothetical protein GCM10011513_03400 [Franconibacter daqui]|nr:hypothetical protein GCM10011513_03400 [Franconibacter daqui]
MHKYISAKTNRVNAFIPIYTLAKYGKGFSNNKSDTIDATKDNGTASIDTAQTNADILVLYCIW